MFSRTTSPSTKSKFGRTGLSRLAAVWVALICLTVPGISINLLFGASVRAIPEEINEHAKCEVNLLGASHRCARDRFVGDRRAYVYQLQLRRVDGVVYAARPTALLVTPHLVGSGIRIRC